MGCGASKGDDAGKARNDEIENRLKRDKMAQRNEIKMLLLGTNLHAYLEQRNILIICRRWRIWKVHNSETDEAHPRRRLLKRREGIIQRDHLLKYRTVDASNSRGNGVARAPS